MPCFAKTKLHSMFSCLKASSGKSVSIRMKRKRVDEPSAAKNADSVGHGPTKMRKVTPEADTSSYSGEPTTLLTSEVVASELVRLTTASLPLGQRDLEQCKRLIDVADVSHTNGEVAQLFSILHYGKCSSIPERIAELEQLQQLASTFSKKLPVLSLANLFSARIWELLIEASAVNLSVIERLHRTAVLVLLHLQRISEADATADTDESCDKPLSSNTTATNSPPPPRVILLNITASIIAAYAKLANTLPQSARDRAFTSIMVILGGHRRSSQLANLIDVLNLALSHEIECSHNDIAMSTLSMLLFGRLYTMLTGPVSALSEFLADPNYTAGTHVRLVLLAKRASATLHARNPAAGFQRLAIAVRQTPAPKPLMAWLSAHPEALNRSPKGHRVARETLEAGPIAVSSYMVTAVSVEHLQELMHMVGVHQQAAVRDEQHSEDEHEADQPQDPLVGPVFFVDTSACEKIRRREQLHTESAKRERSAAVAAALAGSEGKESEHSEDDQHAEEEEEVVEETQPDESE